MPPPASPPHPTYASRWPILTAIYDFWDDEIWGAQYITHRRVGIQDRRLTYIHRALQFLVLVYVVVIELVLWHRYAAFETPAGYVNAWPAAYQPMAGALPYCGNPALDWGFNLTAEELQYTSGYRFGPNSSCLPYAADRDLDITSSSASFASYIAYAPLDATKNWSRSYYIEHPEGASINIQHVMSASFISGGISNVRTEVADAAGNVLRSYPAGSYLEFSVADWLAFSGASLADTQEFPSWYPGVRPVLRQTGVVILARMTYTNRRTWEFPSLEFEGAPLLRIVCEALPVVWGFDQGITVADIPDPTTGVSSPEPVSFFKTSIRVEFVVSGSVGAFDFFTLVSRLVEAVVLFGVATFITDTLARCVLHRASYHAVIVSRVTAEQLSETRHWRRRHRKQAAHGTGNGIRLRHPHGAGANTAAAHPHAHHGHSGAHSTQHHEHYSGVDCESSHDLYRTASGTSLMGRSADHTTPRGGVESPRSAHTGTTLHRGVSWVDEVSRGADVGVRRPRSSLSLHSMRSLQIEEELAGGSGGGGAVNSGSGHPLSHSSDNHHHHVSDDPHPHQHPHHHHRHHLGYREHYRLHPHLQGSTTLPGAEVGPELPATAAAPPPVTDASRAAIPKRRTLDDPPHNGSGVWVSVPPPQGQQGEGEERRLHDLDGQRRGDNLQLTVDVPQGPMRSSRDGPMGAAAAAVPAASRAAPLDAAASQLGSPQGPHHHTGGLPSPAAGRLLDDDVFLTSPRAGFAREHGGGAATGAAGGAPALTPAQLILAQSSKPLLLSPLRSDRAAMVKPPQEP